MKRGYILIVTMLIIAASMVIVTTVVKRTAAYKKLSTYTYAREKAKLLALSGVQVALAQLGAITAEKDEQKQIASLLLLIDRKQTFTMREEQDGIDGEIDVIISSEQGKININALYDFKEHKFVGEQSASLNTSANAAARDDRFQGQNPQLAGQLAEGSRTDTGNGKKILQLLCEKLQPKIKEKEVFGKLERFLKERKKPLIDPTELIEVLQFKKGLDSAQELRALFTVFTENAQLQPLVLSPALGTLFGFKNWSEAEDGRKKQIEEITKKIKTAVNWSQEWNTILGSIYGKDYAAVPTELRSLLQSKFESNWLSVVSYGTYNSLTQKLCIVLEKEVSTGKDALSLYHVRRIYWL